MPVSARRGMTVVGGHDVLVVVSPWVATSHPLELSVSAWGLMETKIEKSCDAQSPYS